MDSGHAVGAVRANDRKIRHADFSLVALFNQAHALNAPFVTRESNTDIVEQPTVNLVDDLQLTGKKYLKPGHGPFLESLRQQRVICVGKGRLRQPPSLLPSQVRIIQ